MKYEIAQLVYRRGVLIEGIELRKLAQNRLSLLALQNKVQSTNREREEIVSKAVALSPLARNSRMGLLRSLNASAHLFYIGELLAANSTRLGKEVGFQTEKGLTLGYSLKKERSKLARASAEIKKARLKRVERSEELEQEELVVLKNFLQYRHNDLLVKTAR